MALVIFGKSHCAISDKVIQRDDNFVCFPPFPSKPTDPLYKCSDGCVLRVELENWKYKENVLEASKNFWLQHYASSQMFTTIFRDDTYLVLHGTIENKIRIIFFQYGLVVDLPASLLSEIYNHIRHDFDELHFQVYPNSLLTLEKDKERTRLMLTIKEVQQDCIILSKDEWKRFCTLIQTIRQRK
ncbi:MAG: hypothetical protein D6711_16285 [Chloroflexi bacterium]|nr:MAG: hypothetical protein D6711_16285 [Chloroflexota bacterium]